MSKLLDPVPLARPAEGASAQDALRFEAVLHQVALTAASFLDLEEILRRLASLTLEVIPADRCHLFLLDESGTKLLPTTSIARIPDLAMWQRFKSLNPIDLKAVPGRWEAFTCGRALSIPDMAASPLVPEEIVEVFGSRSALVMPLVASGETVGVLALDCTAPGKDFSKEETVLFEAIGGYAAQAIRSASYYQKLASKNQALERLVRLAAALNGPLSLDSVLDMVCSGFEELLGTSHCSVNLIEEGRHPTLRTLAVRGVTWFTREPQRVEVIDQREVARVTSLWKRTGDPVVYRDLRNEPVAELCSIPSSVKSVALFPLLDSKRLRGLVVAGFPMEDALSPELLDIGRALAEGAANAIGRALLHRDLHQRLQRTQILYHLSDVVSGSTKLATALRRLNQILPELGIRLRSIHLANARLREAVGAQPPGEEEMEAIRSWRTILAKTGGSPRPRRSSHGWLVPIVHHKRVQGALGVALQNGENAWDEDFLVALGTACAEVISKASLRQSLVEMQRRMAISLDRERIARDLHDSVGHLLMGMGLSLTDYISEAPDSKWRQRLQELKKQASKGDEEVRQAIHSLTFLQVRSKGLVHSLRELVRRFETATGISATVRVVGDEMQLSPEHQDALFRVAHEALTNVQRHAQASRVVVTLGLSDKEAKLAVKDDGVGWQEKGRDHDGVLHFGLSGVGRLMEGIGGDLTVKGASPHGTVVSARIRLKTRKGGRANAKPSTSRPS